MSEAYGLSLVAVLAALSIGILRVAVVRPTVLLVLGIAGVFGAGYVFGHMTQHADEGWAHAGAVPVGALRAGSGTTDMASLREPLNRGLPLKNASRISVGIFDSAASGVSENHESVAVPKGAQLQIAGWAADEKSPKPCKALYLAVGTLLFDVPYGLARPDVAAAFKDPAYMATGFSAHIPTAGLAKGTYPAHVECLAADGSALFVLSQPRTIVVE